MASVLTPPMRLVQTAKRIYVPVALLATLIALAGFWPTYFGPLLAGTVDTVPIIHVHAAVFTGWLMLVIAQGTLAATGRTALHVKVGKIGMGYGVFLIFLVWLSSIYVAMAYDYFRRKIVHPVYVIGLVTLSLFRLRNPVKETETWLSISGWLASFYT